MRPIQPMRPLRPLTLAEFDSQPFRLGGTAKLDADPLAVFAELGDPSLFFPLMRRSVWKSAATGGVNAEREIEHRLLGRAREKMLVWEPGVCVAFTMTAASSPFVSSIGEEWLLAREDIYTRVSWRFVATPTALGRAVTPALRALLRTMFVRACSNLQRRAGTFKGESRAAL